MAPTTRRHWLSPLTMVLFVVLVLSGVPMFLHLHVPGVNALHQVAGIAFAVAGALHLVTNWRAFRACFAGRRGWVALAVALTLCAAVVVGGAAHDGERHDRRPARLSAPGD